MPASSSDRHCRRSCRGPRPSTASDGSDPWFIYRAGGAADAGQSALGGDTAAGLLHALGSPSADQVRVEHVTVLDRKGLDNSDYDMRVRCGLVTPNASDTDTRDLLLERTDEGSWRAVPHARTNGSDSQS